MVMVKPFIRLLIYTGRAEQGTWYAQWNCVSATTVREAWVKVRSDAGFKAVYPRAEFIAFQIWDDPAYVLSIARDTNEFYNLVGSMIRVGQVFPGYVSAYAAFCANSGLTKDESALFACHPTHPGWFDDEDDDWNLPSDIFNQTEDRLRRSKPKNVLIHEVPRTDHDVYNGEGRRGYVVDPDDAMAAVRAMCGKQL